jgi:excinuclease ABC subunit A
MQERLVDSLTTCLKHSGGIAVINIIANKSENADGSAADASSGNPAGKSPDKLSEHPSEYPGENPNPEPPPQPADLVFSENFACPEHGAVMEELSPRLFSFNSPYGACPDCHGLGSLRKFSPDLIIPNPDLPVYAAIAPWSDKDNTYYLSLLCSVAEAYGFDIKTPWDKLSDAQKEIILYGSPDPIWIETDSRYREAKGYNRASTKRPVQTPISKN